MAQSSPRHFQLWLFFFIRNGIFMPVRLSIFISVLSRDMVTNTIPFIWFFTYQVFLESGGRLQFIKEGLHLIQCKAHACCCLERAGIHTACGILKSLWSLICSAKRFLIKPHKPYRRFRGLENSVLK